MAVQAYGYERHSLPGSSREACPPRGHSCLSSGLCRPGDPRLSGTPEGGILRPEPSWALKQMGECMLASQVYPEPSVSVYRVAVTHGHGQTRLVHYFKVCRLFLYRV